MGEGDPHASPTAAARWLSKAAEDLEVAELVMRSAAGPRWAACFHAQQAAEKAVKAVLVGLGIDFPRSHALDRLVALMPTEVAAGFDGADLAGLDPWAVAGRYPEEVADPSEELAGALVTAPRRVVATARRLAAAD